MSDQKTLGKDDFAQIPNGAPGVEDRLLMIHHFGVNEGRITLNRMVELLSTNPAKLFGLYPRKGTIAPGSDADIVIFDPEKEHTISAKTHHSKADYNLYEGTTVVGAPEVVMLRGDDPRRGRRARRQAGHRSVRQAGTLREGAQAGASVKTRSSGTSCGSTAIPSSTSAQAYARPIFSAFGCPARKRS